MARTPSNIDRTTGRLVVLALVALVFSLLAVLGLVAVFRFGTLWTVLLLPVVVPVAFISAAIIARMFTSKRRSCYANADTTQA